MKDANKICFVTCVRDEDLYEECLLYLQHLYVPSGLQFEFLPIRKASSMAAGYNEALRKSKAKYKVYVHEDVLLLKKDCMVQLLQLFREQPKIGLVGLIGCCQLPPSAVWWQGRQLRGRVLHAPEPESLVPSVCEDISGEFCRVEAVDGLFLATQYDLPWREDLFNGWHFYDVSQCLEFHRHGYGVAIPSQGEDWCMHLTRQKPLRLAYWQYQKLFLQEYGTEMACCR